MRNRKAVIVGASLASALVIYFSLPLEWRWSLTTDTMSVFVCDTDELDGGKCLWSGTQHFEIILPNVRAQFRVMLFSTAQVLVAIVETEDGVQIEPNSVEIRLTSRDFGGNTREIHLTPTRTPGVYTFADGSIESWHHRFSINEDLLELPKDGLSLIWSLKYRNIDGQLVPVSITIPLRRETISIPSSFVRSGYNKESHDNNLSKG